MEREQPRLREIHDAHFFTDRTRRIFYGIMGTVFTLSAVAVLVSMLALYSDGRAPANLYMLSGFLLRVGFAWFCWYRFNRLKPLKV